MAERNSPPFQLGLCLAGAISAGAYTAGVMDYLIEALEEWQKRKDNNVPGTPCHQVVIPVIGGASAGGMTGIITGSTVNQKHFPLSEFPQPLHAQQSQNKLYHSWVDLTHDDMFPVMLDVDDIKAGQIRSLLNSTFIDVIADRAIQTIPTQEWIYPKYFEKHLKIFTTLSNLQGFEFNVAFNSNIPNNKYLMQIHNDYACFELNKEEKDYNQDGWMPLNFHNHRQINTAIARDAAMATGAFPIGLKARTVTRESKYVNENTWLLDVMSENPLTHSPYTSINVDGGLINNEPFEKVQVLLRNITRETISESQAYNTFRSTMLMIDPFPSEDEKFDRNEDVRTVVGNTLSAMTSQMRAKRELLQDAMDSNKAGQFLIAPTRPDPLDPEIKWNGSRAIACGTLGGFGGFIHKNFRIHDFFLGRANCERFLRHYFTVPQDTTNPIFKEGYDGIEKKNFTSSIDRGLQIIPIFSEEAKDIRLPDFGNTNWPVVEHEQIDRFRCLLKDRAQALILNFDDYRWDTKVLLWLGAKAVLNRKLADMAIKKIKKSLMDYNLLR